MLVELSNFFDLTFQFYSTNNELQQIISSFFVALYQYHKIPLFNILKNKNPTTIEEIIKVLSYH